MIAGHVATTVGPSSEAVPVDQDPWEILFSRDLGFLSSYQGVAVNCGLPPLAGRYKRLVTLALVDDSE
jgi:hypothetical protein